LTNFDPFQSAKTHQTIKLDAHVLKGMGNSIKCKEYGTSLPNIKLEIMAPM
jgi:hypothetical protein